MGGQRRKNRANYITYKELGLKSRRGNGPGGMARRLENSLYIVHEQWTTI